LSSAGAAHNRNSLTILFNHRLHYFNHSPCGHEDF
jgi:hypothetical protein